MNNKLSTHQEKQTDLPMLTIKGRTTLPIIQGWMGVGISNWRLAWAVAREWGIGTLSAVGHPMTPAYKKSYLETIKVIDDVIKILDDAAREKGTKKWDQAFFDAVKTQIFYNANLDCIGEEVRKAQNISEGRGSLYMNIMVATEDYERQVLASCRAWVHGIVSGAGFPFALPEITKDYPDIALIPILSSARWVGIILKRWKRHKKTPDAIILEDPSRAAGHLWAPKLEDLKNEETRLEYSIPETKALLQKMELDIPIIAAWGATDREDFDRILALGASWVQMGTRFLATHESGASQKFKQDVVDTWKNNIFEYTSSAMLPARATDKSTIFEVIKHQKPHVRKCVKNCLTHCARRDGIGVLPNGETPAQMCLLYALANATEGNPPTADRATLEFLGTSAVKIYALKSVEEIMNELAYPKK